MLASPCLFPMAKSTLSPASALIHTGARSVSFDCPKTDQDGASLTGQGLNTGVNSNGNGSSSQTDFTCTYRDGAGTCIYDENGVLQSGSSACPDGSPATSSTSSTQVVTETQVVTKTPPPPSSSFEPPPTSSTSSSETSPPALHSTSSASPTSLPSRSDTSAAGSTSAFSSRPISPSPSSTGVSIPTSSTSIANTGLPIAGGSKKSLTEGAIAGIVLGALALLVLVTLIFVCQTRRKRRRSALEELQPESYFINPASSTRPQPLNGLKSAVTSPSDRTVDSDLAQSRQEYLTTQLREVQKRLEALQSSAGNSTHLEEAMEENEVLRARIRMLEAEMQSQWGRGLSDSPPAYLD
ncbi:hypothetical protein C8R47DRAFT_1153940 [Mycena vitilis]|nr:hypothetical protein C8R47DRAFT_1153940 [Mycena vitilis]